MEQQGDAARGIYYGGIPNIILGRWTENERY